MRKILNYILEVIKMSFKTISIFVIALILGIIVSLFSLPIGAILGFYLGIIVSIGVGVYVFIRILQNYLRN